MVSVMVFFYDLHAALTLTSVPTAVFILLHLTVCLQLCIFYVSTVHAAVCIHPTCGRLFKDFLFVPLCLHLKCKKNNGSAFLGVCDLGRELLHPGPLWPLWHFSWTWTECFGDTIAASTPLNVSRWRHGLKTPFFFFFFLHFPLRFPKGEDGKMDRCSWTLEVELEPSRVQLIWAQF